MSNKKPLKLHVRDGTYQKCRHDGVEPEYDYQTPEPPEIINGAALNEWNRVTAELSRLGLLTILDRACLTQYCILWKELMKYDEDNPLPASWHNQFKLVYQQLGLSVASRAGLRLPDKSKDKPKSVFGGKM